MRNLWLRHPLVVVDFKFKGNSEKFTTAIEHSIKISLSLLATNTIKANSHE